MIARNGALKQAQRTNGTWALMKSEWAQGLVLTRN